MISKAEFIDWKNHPVTKDVVKQLQQRVEQLYEMLGSSAGINSIQDSQYVGAIKAYKDVIQLDYEEEGEAS